jgi:molybdopterin molybdotransferase
MGEKDFTTVAFSESGYDVKFKKIEIKPGKPFVFCTGENIATLLTGNPFASVLNYNIFVKPLIRKMAGCKEYYHKFQELTLQSDIKRKAGRDEVIAGNIDELGFTPYPKKGSGMISVMAKSDGVVILDKSVWEKRKGEKVKYLSFRSFDEKFKEFISE